MREMSLPSGAVLKITLAPFDDSRDLYQAVLEEAKGLKMDPRAEVDANFYKDILCTAMASKVIEAKIWKCMEKCLYNGVRIKHETFEPEEAREDYFMVLFEVAVDNVRPFTKGLSVQFSHIAGVLAKLQG